MSNYFLFVTKQNRLKVYEEYTCLLNANTQTNQNKTLWVVGTSGLERAVA